jgi:SprT-like family
VVATEQGRGSVKERIPEGFLDPSSPPLYIVTYVTTTDLQGDGIMGSKTITNKTDLSKLSVADLCTAINVDTDPTRGQFLAYTAAYDYFNKRLWDGKLPRCILNFSRKTKYAGFFAPERWQREANLTHEISLNPDVLERDSREIMSTLVHEMAHLWQQENGKPSRNGYHNAEWAAEMNRIGLKPVSCSGDPEKQTGQRMTHEIVEDGPFATAFEYLPREYLLPWLSGAGQGGEKKPKSKNQDKAKFVCPQCGIMVWGKSGLDVLCGACTLEALQGENPKLITMVEEVKDGAGEDT